MSFSILSSRNPPLGISAHILIPESVMSCHTWFRIKVRSVSVPRLDPGYVLISCQFPTAGVNVTLSALNPPPIRGQDWPSLTNQAPLSRCQEGRGVGGELFYLASRLTQPCPSQLGCPLFHLDPRLPQHQIFSANCFWFVPPVILWI